MCVSPITLKQRKLDGSFVSRVVPCGRCPECRSKAQSAFALEAVLEARAASSMYFVTLTYNDDSVPIMGRRIWMDNDCYELQECWFEPKNTKRREVCLSLLKPDLSGRVAITTHSHIEDYGYCTESAWNEVHYTPSLCREDVIKWIKRCRVRWKRLHNEDLNLRYAFFGEYGAQTARPHYHGILLNLTPAQSAFMSSSWSQEFGFCDFKFVPAFNSDGSPARVKVVKYVSKYIAKEHYYSAIDLGLVEKPRRFSSLGFGKKCLSPSDIQSLKNFIYAEI